MFGFQEGRSTGLNKTGQGPVVCKIAIYNKLNKSHYLNTLDINLPPHPVFWFQEGRSTGLDITGSGAVVVDISSLFTRQEGTLGPTGDGRPGFQDAGGGDT